MADRKPPRDVAGERDTLLALWQYQRESLVRKVTGIDDDAARRRFVGSDMTLLWLMKHMAQAETLWIVHRFAGEPAGPAGADVGAGDTLAAAIDEYRATWPRVDAIVAAASFDDVCRDTGAESPVNLRWVCMHLLEETARHAGHADILCEMIDGRTGR